jgi:hypothetical protein
MTKYIPYSNFHLNQAMTFLQGMLRSKFQNFIQFKILTSLRKPKYLELGSFTRYYQHEKCRNVRYICEFCVFEDYIFNLADNFSRSDEIFITTTRLHKM